MKTQDCSRRQFLATGLGTAAGAPMILSQRQAAAGPGKKPPNIVWIIADDVGRYTFGCYGNPTVRTPNIDRLAAEGVRFTNAYVTSPSCSPSRATLFTGMYAHSVGAEDLHDPLPADAVTCHELLKEAGYHTANIAKCHLGKEKEDKFNAVYKSMRKWAEFFEERPKDKPFFLAVGFHDAHRPFARGCVDPPHDPERIVVPPFLPDVEETREDLAGFYDEIARMDKVIGDIIARIEAEGELDNTFIMFCGDNGMPFPRAKNSLYDPGIVTPLVLWWPGRITPGSEYHRPAITLDWAPTTLEAAGIPIPAHMQGRSYFPQIADPPKHARTEVYAERNWHDFDDHSRCVCDSRYKYIRNSFPEKALLPAADLIRSPTFQKMREMRDAGTLTDAQMLLFRPDRDPEELYDRVRDGGEFHNVAGDPAYAPVLERMRKKLDAWVKETDDVPPSKSQPDTFDPETGERLRRR